MKLFLCGSKMCPIGEKGPIGVSWEEINRIKKKIYDPVHKPKIVPRRTKR